MLILSRKPGESIVIDGRIVVKVIRLDGDIVKLGIEAPREVPVHRQEVYEEIQQSNQEALTDTRPMLPRLSSVNPMPSTLKIKPGSAKATLSSTPAAAK